MRLSDVQKRFKGMNTLVAMCVLVLLHGRLIVIYNLRAFLSDFSALTMIVILLVVVVSVLVGYLVLTRRLWVILGVSLFCAYGLSLSFGQFTNHWPPIDLLVWFGNPDNFLVDAIYVLEAIIPLLGTVILFREIKTNLKRKILIKNYR